MMPTMMRVGGGLLAVEPQHGRNNKLHRLKTLTHFYSAVLIGLKTFEVRFNDRDFQAGDFLLLQEYDPNTETYGRETAAVFDLLSDALPDAALLDDAELLGWLHGCVSPRSVPMRLVWILLTEQCGWVRP